MTRRVILQPTAIDDVEGIVSYLAERSPAGAIRWCDRWDDVLTDLADDPGRYAAAAEAERHDADIRQVTFSTRRGSVYRALFVVQDKTVHVLHVRGPGQDLLPPQSVRPPEQA